MDLFTTPSAASASVLTIAPCGQSNNALKKTRSACTRCHSQKLRCVRQKGQARCDRCLKLKTICRFDLRAPRVSPKPRGQDTACDQGELQHNVASISMPYTHMIEMYTNTNDRGWEVPPNSKTQFREGPGVVHPEWGSSQSSSSNMQDMCWSGLAFDSTLGHCNSVDFQLTTPSQNMLDHESNILSPSTSNCQPRIYDHDWNNNLKPSVPSHARRLGDLSVSLSECAEKLPSTAPSRFSGSRKLRILAVDELFCLTNEFIDTLGSISLSGWETSSTFSSIHPTQLSAQFASSNNEHLFDQEHHFSKDNLRPPSGVFSNVDEATVSMVFACHSWLTEIYTSIFQMMQACIEHSLPPQLGRDWAVILPKLEVGSLSSQPVKVDADTPLKSATTISMYMLVITILSAQLWEKLMGILIAGNDVSIDSATNSRIILTDTMWNTMADRTGSLIRTMDITKQYLSSTTGEREDEYGPRTDFRS
ncbi:hypothetical protein LOCC1_G004019 [Lachnellula occidentalis]|uniref:Zn(2)-C6 fungal-type domain-containing protein n=1 Tax=Lachnellula occidentalis TaxID=215460 RepID=A0A8H8UIS7_9HELO|nr:hypothetical protein LOCC1_G004019 [Lachnellula occidentalis]